MKQNVVKLRDLNIPVRYFKLHNKKLRKIRITHKRYTTQYVNINYSSSKQITFLVLYLEDNKYKVQFADGLWVSYHLPDRLKKLEAWLNLMGYSYESYLQGI